MPTLDFTDIVESVEFTDTITITSTVRVIGSNGEETDTPGTPVTIQAIVIPGKASTIRKDDGSRVTAFIEIITTYRLTAGSKTDDITSRGSDVVLWHGRSYQVMAIEDYTAFGAGFVLASCDLQTLGVSN